MTLCSSFLTGEMSGGVTSPVLDTQDPVTHYFHQNPGHCSDSLAAINKMRQNIQVSHSWLDFMREKKILKERYIVTRVPFALLT